MDDRTETSEIKLTNIGAFGLLRKERPSVSEHFHTGIDIMRPSSNYENEAIYPICEGKVISKRDDGAYAQLILEHQTDIIFWTVYEHIAGIEVGLNEYVDAETPIARFMNKQELNEHGWQFDHVHFEVLKVKPIVLDRSNTHPERRFASRSLSCYTKTALDRYFYDPLEFLKK